jgi:hypothetical protein
MAKKIKRITARQRARRTIRALKLDSGGSYALLVKAGSPIANEENLKALANAIRAAGSLTGFVAVVDSFDDLGVMDEASLNAIGWHYLGDKNGGQ